MTVNQLVLSAVQGKGFCDIFKRYGGDQTGTDLSVGHGIFRADAEHDQSVSRSIASQSHPHFFPVQGLQKGGKVFRLDHFSVNHFKIAFRRAEGQIIEIPHLTTVFHFLIQALRSHSLRLNHLFQALHLTEPLLDRSFKMSGKLLAHAGHIQLAQLIKPFRAFPVQYNSCHTENHCAEYCQSRKTDYKKSGSLFAQLIAVHTVTFLCFINFPFRLDRFLSPAGFVHIPPPPRL